MSPCDEALKLQIGWRAKHLATKTSGAETYDTHMFQESRRTQRTSKRQLSPQLSLAADGRHLMLEPSVE